jgi:hypothetical protein
MRSASDCSALQEGSVLRSKSGPLRTQNVRHFVSACGFPVRLTTAFSTPWRASMRATIRALLMFIALVSLSNAAEQTSTRQISDLPSEAQASISATIGKATPAYFAETVHGGFDAENVAQGLRTRFTTKGVELQVRSDSAMSVRSYGYQGEPRFATLLSPQAVTNRVEYRRGSRPPNPTVVSPTPRSRMRMISAMALH